MTAPTLDPAPTRADYFFVWMAAACAVVAFGGFAPTYWLQLPAGTFVGPPLLHMHGVLFSAWTLLLLSQTFFAAKGKLELHRAWGVAGIALATAMVFLGVGAAIISAKLGVAAGYGDAARQFLIVPVSALALFAGFFIAAIVNLRRRDAHKRLMMLATISLLQAAVARVFFVLATGGGPGARPGLGRPLPLSTAIAPGLLVELLIIAGVIYDWRTRGRPHPTWLVGAAVITAVVLLRGPLATNPYWLVLAEHMIHFSG